MAVRPSSARKRATVVAVAEQLFVEHGFDRVTLDGIADAADVSKQTVYSYFAGKDQLFAEVVGNATDRVFTTLEIAERDPDDRQAVGRQLHEVAARQLDGVLAPEVLALRRLAVAESRRFPELGRRFWDGGAQRTVEVLAAALQRWHDAGLVEVADALHAAATFNWMLLGQPVNRAMLTGDHGLPAGPARRAHVDEVVRVFLAAYGSRSPDLVVP